MSEAQLNITENIEHNDVVLEVKNLVKTFYVGRGFKKMK